MNEEAMQIVHKTSLRLLKIFIEICEKNNLRYYVGGGTMLGAVRHKGFIPWDDDVDIDMPRKDYQEFLKICAEELKDHPECAVSSIHTDNAPFLYARLVDKSVKAKTNEGIISDAIVPLWIDISPVDGMPDNAILREIHWLRLCALKDIFCMSVIKYGRTATNEDKKKRKEKREWYKKIAFWLGEKLPMEKILKYESWARRFEKATEKYSFYESKMAGTLFTYHRKKSIFPVEWYGKGTKYQFEDIEVVGVDNYDAWLTQLYGDYMKVPDEADRVDHALYEIVDMENNK